MGERKDFFDIAVRYYEYASSQKDSRTERNNLKHLRCGGTASDEFKKARKKFCKCLNYFGLDDRNIFKRGRRYAFFEADVDYFAKLMYRFTSKKSALKKAKKGKTKFIAEDMFYLMLEIDEFVGVVSKYVSGEEKENICNKIYCACNYNQMKIEKMKHDVLAEFNDIVDNTLAAKAESSISTCRYLTDKDRLGLFEELDGIIGEFKKRMEKVDTYRRDELYQNFIAHKKTSGKNYDSLEAELRKNYIDDEIFYTTMFLIRCGVNDDNKQVRDNKFKKQEKTFTKNHFWEDDQKDFGVHNEQVRAYMDLIKNFKNTVMPLKEI